MEKDKKLSMKMTMEDKEFPKAKMTMEDLKLKKFPTEEMEDFSDEAAAKLERKSEAETDMSKARRKVYKNPDIWKDLK